MQNLYKLQPDVTTYTLSLVFEFVILPELRSFLHSVVLEASLRDICKIFRLL